MPTVHEELATLKVAIEVLLEANRLDWVELAEKPMTREERLNVRKAIAHRDIKAIAHRDIELVDLVERKWEIIHGQI